MRRAGTPNVDLFISHDTFTLRGTRIRSVGVDEETRRACAPSPPPSSVHVKGHKGLVRHMGVHGFSPQQRNIEFWHPLCKSVEMGRMSFEVVRSSTRDSNLIIPPILEPSRLFRNLMEEVQPLFLGAPALFDHACEGMDFGSDVDHGGGEDGIEFAEVAYVAREVEGERVEGVGVFGEEGEGVGGVELRRRGRRGRQ